jgi:hypothetical protein
MKNILFSVCILIFFAGCKKHNDTQSSSSTHIFKGIVVTNEGGEVLGTWGTEDGDWGNDINWSNNEYELLNFPDTISLDGTFVADTTGWNIGPGVHQQPRNFVIAYPNPLLNGATLVLQGIGNLKCKAAIVDKNYHRLKTYAGKWNGLLEIMVDLSDSTTFQDKTMYRIFYSFSAKDSLNFYKGHGDILVCREPTMNDCRQAVP